MSLTILPELEQGTPEWFDQRRGLVTASVVGNLLTVRPPGAIEYACPDCAADPGSPCVSLSRKSPTPNKNPHDARVTYAAWRKDVPPIIEVADNETSSGLIATLVAERITGFTEDSPMTPAMWRGVEHEPYARDVYAEHYAPVDVVGFMRRDEDGWSLGYSPDGLVGDAGLLEIKCPRAKTHLRTILADEVPAHYMAQCQAGLLVSGREWIDFMSFVGGMPPFVKRVEPDERWFKAIVAAVAAFEENANEIARRYFIATTGLPATTRVIEMEMSL